ncbi:MAG: hypothetical protein P8129_10760 [Anaerolineae bacterium]
MPDQVDWEVWYRDTFDRECPPSVDARGHGLVRGLTELWARHLFETVRPDGGQGFSRFHLRRKPGEPVQIEGDQEGAARLRAWVFGEQEHTERGYVEAGDARLLSQIAAAHAALLGAGRPTSGSPQILAAAAAAHDRQAFERYLRSVG